MNANKCQVPTHNNKKILSVCFHTTCSGKRVCCQMCQSDEHKDHSDQLVELEDALNFIKTQSQKKPSDPSPLVNQRLQELTNILKNIEELSKLITEEMKRLKSSNEQDIFHYIGYEYNIIQNDRQALSNKEWNKLVEDIFPIVRIDQCNIFPKETTNDYISNIMNSVIDISTSIQQQLISIQNNFQAPQFLQGHGDLVNEIDICKHRNLLASGSIDKTVKLWDLNQNTLINTYKYTGEVQYVVFSDQKNLLAYGGTGEYSIVVVDFTYLKQENIIAQLSQKQENIYYLSFSKDSQQLRSWGADTFRIWDLNSKNETYQFQVKLINALTISYDDSLIAFITESGEIKIQYLYSQKMICTQLAHDDEGLEIEFSNNQKMLVSFGGDEKVKLWSLEKLIQGRLLLIREIQIVNTCIQEVFFSYCSKFLIYFCDDFDIKVIDIQTGYVVKQFKSKSTNDYKQFCAAFSKDMKIIAFSEDNNIVVLRQKQ